MKEIRKAVIPAAGLGTRFLPVAKSVPKELVPIGLTPIIQLVVEEAAASGIKEAIIVTSPVKRAIADYFSLDTPYAHELRQQGKEHLIERLRSLLREIKITFVEQTKPRGLGDAILKCKKAVGDEPFCVMLPDHIFVAEKPCAMQLIESCAEVGASINAVERVFKDKVSDYGIYQVDDDSVKLMKASRVVEKPKPEEAPSDIAVIGRYVFMPKVFEILETLTPGRNGEIQLADAQNELARLGEMYALLYDGYQFDTGDEWGYLKAVLYTANKNYPAQTNEFFRRLNV